MSLTAWFKDRHELHVELAQARKALADNEGLVAAVHFAQEDSARLERQRNQLARELDAARAALRDLGQKPGPVGWVPLPELLREKARADALADRVQQLQEANMAHDRAAPH